MGHVRELLKRLPVPDLDGSFKGDLPYRTH